MSISFVSLRHTFLTLIAPRTNRLPEYAGTVPMDASKNDESSCGERVKHHASLLHRKALLQFSAWFILGSISLVAQANDLQLGNGGGGILEQGTCASLTLDQWCAQRAYKDIQHYPDVKPTSCYDLTYFDCKKASYPRNFPALYCKTTYYSCYSSMSTVIGYIGVACPPGQDWIAPDRCSTTPQQLKVIGGQNIKEGCDKGPASQSGNPIDYSFGNKIFTETSYRGSGAFPIEFTLTYNSLAWTAASGTYWHYSYGQRITHSTDWTTATVTRENGASFIFKLVNGIYVADPDVTARLEKTGDGLQWIYTLPDQTREYYNTNSGAPTSIRNRYGLVQTIIYDSTGFTVTGPQGESLRVNMTNYWQYPGSIVDSQGRTNSYSWGGSNLNYLTQVTYPDGKHKQYLYELTSSPQLVTGVMDENGRLSNVVVYDSSGRATRSELYGGVERVDVAYNVDGSVTLTNALGKKTTYSFQTIQGVRKITHVEGVPSANCQGTGKDFAYDANGFLTQKTDALGVITNYTRDGNGLELSRTEAAGTVDARTITTQWDTSKRLPLVITEGNRVTTFTYDADGHLLSHTITDTSLGQSRTFTYSYNAVGLIETVNGPRTDVSDITTYGYDSHSALATVTNALGHVTTIVSRDAVGRPTLVSDPNGLQTALTYDSRGRLITTSTGGETTTLTYDGVGNVTQVTPPDGAVLNYTYDNANRLTRITDASGNYLSYTLDLQGNRTAIKLYDASNTLLRSQTRVYDELSRLIKSIGASGQTTQISYDKNDNPVTTTDPLSHLFQSAYDPLNRLIQQTDALNGTSGYGYDEHDRLTSVTDPNNHTTTYSYNGLGDLITQTSPDTGTTSFSYDSAGNLLNRTDAKGQGTTYSYDALNRLTQASYADSSVINYSYDTAQNGLGRLAAVSSASSTTSYSYDSHGRLTSRVEAIAHNGTTTPLTTGYSYNTKGQLVTLTYPSGQVIGYQYNIKGQLTGLTLNGQTLLSSITWSPFGPVKGWTWSNGKSYTRSFDQDGRITSHTLGNGSKTLSYDADSNITAINSALYSYDALHRLVAANDSAFTLSWQYDANGNRTSQISGGLTTSYTLDTNSNQLLVAGTASYSYDANGSLITDGTHSYQYDAQGRLVSVDNGALGQYRYNAQGQRVYKWGLIQGTTTERLFAYDGWKLLGEYDTSGTAQQETVWLDNLPVVTIQSGSVYNVFPDHLGTPRVITNAANTEVWKWDSDPFGTAPANDDADGDGIKFTYNLRLPGQYFDAETGHHQNYFRDYDPETGRYKQSDPIGLRGGLNTYTYVEGNPLIGVDVFGQANSGSWPKRPPRSFHSLPETFSMMQGGICQIGDGTCGDAMTAAGIPGPYYPEKHTYSTMCVATVGLAVKVPVTTIGNKVVKNAPKYAVKYGAPAAVTTASEGLAYLWSNPLTAVVGVAAAADKVLEECEVKPPPPCK